MSKISDLVIFQNNQFIVMNKPAGMPVQEDQSGDKSIHRIAMAYCKHDLFVVHRIDRPASGVVVFAKNKKTAAKLSEQFKQHSVVKKYLVVVNKDDLPEEGEMEDHLSKKSKSNRSEIVEPGTEQAKLAKLKYRRIDEIERYALYEIDLITGRHHQIRAQLAAAGAPIKGDVKYGARRKNEDRSIHLHASFLQFNHPISNEKVEFHADPPTDSVWEAFSYNG